MNKKEVLKLLDYASYIALLIATVLIIIFEVTANMGVYKIGLIVYEVCFLILIVFTIMRISSVFKKEAKEDEDFNLTRGQKTFLIVKLVLVLLGFCLTSTMLIMFK